MSNNFRPHRRSVKKFVRLFVKKKKLFELKASSFSLDKNVQILASEVPAGEFSLLRFFSSWKRNEEPVRL